jgi:DNA replication protein DnaD
MARAMLEYTKMVLQKVSFNMGLFRRELKKASKTLLPYEIEELIIWLREFSKENSKVKTTLIYLENKRSR